ncbi:tape measure protein [Phormidium tenue FACHB-886]|nr:tape measure protein [Phormidium tenue FACHB-886]
MEGVDLGTLLLTLGLNTETYDRGLEKAHEDALETGKAIESAFRGRSNRLPELTVRVNDRALTKLNQHYDLKEDHAKRLQRFLNANPLTPRVNTRELDALPVKLRTLQSEVQRLSNVNVVVRGAAQVSSRAGTQVIKVESDTKALAQGFKDATKDLGDDIGKEVQRGVRKGNQKGITGTLTSAVTAAPKAVLRGFYEGVGITYADQLTRGFIRGVEGKFNTSLRRIGENSGTQILNKAERVGDKLAQKLGLGDSLKIAAGKTSNALKEIIPANVLEQRLGRVETAIAKTLDGMLELKSTAEQLQNLGGVGKALQDVAVVPIEGIDQRRSRKQQQAVERVRARAAEIAPTLPDLPAGATSLNIVSGGFAGTRGKSSASVADRVRLMLGSEAAVDFVENQETDTSANIDKMPKWAGQILARFGKQNVMQGFNQDAIEAAAKALAYQQKGANLPTNFIGYSGGGYVAKEATELLGQMGIRSKGVGIGTPLFGLTGKVSDSQFRAYMGESDPLSKLGGMLSAQQRTTSAGKAHRLSNYLGDQGFQKELGRFLGVGTTGAQPASFELHGFEDELNNLAGELGAVLGDSNQTLFFKKTGLYKGYIEQIKQHRAKLNTLIADAMGDVAEQIESYDQALADAEALVKQVFGVQGEIAPAIKAGEAKKTAVQTAVNPPPVADAKAQKQAIEQAAKTTKQATATDAAKTKKLAEEALKQAKDQLQQAYNQLIIDGAKAIGIDSVRVPRISASDIPSAGTYDAINNKITLPTDKAHRLTMGMGKDISKLSQHELDKTIADLSTIAHESYHAFQGGFSGLSSTELVTQNKNYADLPLSASADAQKQFQRLKRGSINTMAGRSTDTFSKNASLQKLDEKTRQQAIENVRKLEQQAYTFQAQFMAALAQEAKNGSQSVAQAFEKSIAAVVAELKQTAEQVKAKAAAVEVKPAEIAADTSGLQQVEAQLNAYTVEILKEISRVSGRGTPKGKKADIVDDLLKNVKPDSLNASIGAVEPLIERGVKGGMKLQKVQSSEAESKTVANLSKAEKSLAKRLEKLKALQGEAYEKELGTLLDLINQQIAQLDQFGAKTIAAETRLALGQGKGRLEATYRRLSPQLKPKPQSAVSQAAIVENPFSLDDISLARVTQQQGKQVARQALKTYEAIIRSVAKVSGAQMKPGDMPRLVVDNDRLKALGAKALYNIKQNQIIVDESIAKILEQGGKALDEYADELKDLVHEGRHAAQFGFGSLSLKQIGAGASNVNMIDPRNVSQTAKYYALQSVQVANQQASGLLGDRAKRGIYRTEADAYAFEQFTPQVLQQAKTEAQRRGKPEQLTRAYKAATEAPADGLAMVARVAAKAKDVASEGVKGLIEQFVMVNPAVGGVLQKLIGQVGNVPKAFLKFGAIALVAKLVIDNLGRIVGAALDTAMAMEKMGRGFKFAYGSAAAGNQAMQQARERADDLGLGVMQTLEGQQQLAGATRGTKLEGFLTDRMGAALDQTIAVGGADNESAARARRAVSQIAQKGTVQAEELTGQLSEALSGFPVQQIAARSMGVDLSEFIARRDRGEITSEEFLPKFLQQLQAETAGGVGDAKNSSTAIQNRFGNAQVEAQAAIGQTLLPAQNAGLQAMTAALETVNKLLPITIELIAAMGGAVLAGLIQKVELTTIATKGWAGATELAQGAVKGLKGFLTQDAMGFAGVTVGIMGAIELIKGVVAAFADAGQSSRDFADQTQKSIDRYRKALAEARNEKPPELPGASNPNAVAGDTKESFLEGFFGLGGLFGKDKVRALEKNILDNPLAGFGGMGSLLTGLQASGMAPKFNLPRYGEVKAQQQRLGEAEAFSKGGEVFASLQSEIEQFKTNDPNSAIAKLRNANEQLDAIQAQRRGLRPGDVAGRRKLDEQEQTALAQQSRFLNPVSEMQATAASQIENYKAMIKSARERGDEGAAKQYEGELKRAITLQDQFNSLIGKQGGILQSLAYSYSAIVGKLEDANRALEKSANSGKKAIAASQISGTMSSGQADIARSQLDQQNMRGKMGANAQAIQQIDSQLSGERYTKALNSIGLESFGDMPIAQLRERIGQMDEKGEDTRALSQGLEQFQKRQDLDLENSGLETSIEESKAQLVQRLRDLATQINDFYRGIAQQAQETQLQAQQTALQANTAQGQAKLKNAMVGFQESFINDYVESLISLIDILNKPKNDFLQAQQQLLGAQNQYMQQIQQAYQMGQQLPTAEQVAGMPAGGGAAQMPMLTAAQPAGTTAPIAAQSVMPAQSAAGAAQIPSMTPQQFLAGLQGLSQASGQQSVAFGQQGLESAMTLAGQTYATQQQSIATQLQAQYQQAQAEARMQGSNLDYQAFQAGRRMEDQGRTFSRSAEDLQARSLTETPEVQQQSTLRGMSREFEDSMRSMQDFQRGLQATQDQASATIGAIRDGVSQGLYPESMLQRIPQLQQMAESARSQMNQLQGTMAEYEQAYADAIAKQQEEFAYQEQRRRQQAQSRLEGMNSSVLSERANAARLAGQGNVANDLEYRNKVNAAGSEFRNTIAELEEMKRRGEINTNEFKQMKAAAEDLNNLKLDNAAAELDKLNRDNRFAARQQQGGYDNDLLRARADEMRSRYGDDSGAKRLENKAAQQQLGRDQEQQLYNLQKQKEAGEITTGQFNKMKSTLESTGKIKLDGLKRELYSLGDIAQSSTGKLVQVARGMEQIQALRQADDLIKQAGGSTRALLNTYNIQGGNNAYLRDAIGASNPLVAKLAEYEKLSSMTGNAFQGELTAQSVASAVDRGSINSSAAVAKLDELLGVLRQKAGGMTVNIENIGAIGDAGDLISSISQGNMRAAGL